MIFWKNKMEGPGLAGEIAVSYFTEGTCGKDHWPVIMDAAIQMKVVIEERLRNQRMKRMPEIQKVIQPLYVKLVVAEIKCGDVPTEEASQAVRLLVKDQKEALLAFVAGFSRFIHVTAMSGIELSCEYTVVF